MKVAIVCDDLIQHGGAEKIVDAVSDIFSDAPIYTTVATKKWRNYFHSKDRKIVTSFLQKFPFVAKLNRFYSVCYYHVLAIESFDFSDYDLVFSISSRYAHFAITNPSTKHICYLNTPGRMFWEPFDYFEKEFSGVPKFLKAVGMFFVRHFIFLMRLADVPAMKRADMVIANSKITQQRVKKYHGVESSVVNPFCEVPPQTANPTKSDYYLVITRLVSWKHVETAMRACEKLGRNLKIIGEGPDLVRLQKLAGKNVEFLGRVSDPVKWEVLAGCRALINTQKEDFGIVPLEAMASGKPVIAYKAGGALETILDGKTGIFFEEQTAESLSKCIEKFEIMKFNPADCIGRARTFSFENFKCSILEKVNDLICIKS
ncbi:MAG: Glycosyltransferase [candidate division WWE3 bacterium GW2011_GWF2_41_45]|uniref:Glycosyl transferase family 1 domain-containing protein n=2 Tax=Katanobacteria TaxID=422282 RepID=A0A1F4VZN3_UNCKA|nr:MAG: Glycosyltransferase [candidate division WWE3 bacterium GW2011_GWC2_41_23]KKS10071.1 MAG: Glycosyltransferase [candidate division WWE3 bacterium GW2011_GWF2_41_45]KKS12201.1 MAG: Glycosyltransferase [candidate division WWE3 bacterium GW2011_GWF1_41_53]KKS29831.1 MAG: Glycosyltransferase [candidate division WWE3 bacterium GW2011_GWD2_42_11]KKS51397.1 MAG: Glycosyltransferase [candidate division WWE3 bacterium GW2011_GWE2_42_25]KKS60173.1 MAG: Glycosyltransferase [candidate division WWE3 